MDLADEETRVDSPPMFAWRPTVEAWPLDEALEKLGDHAYTLALDQRLSSERARRLLDWTPSAPSVFEELEGGSYS